VLDVCLQLLIHHHHYHHRENRDTTQKVLQLILSHAEAFLSILKLKWYEIHRSDLLIWKSLTLLLAESIQLEGLFEETMHLYTTRFILQAFHLLDRLSRKEVLSSMVPEVLSSPNNISFSSPSSLFMADIPPQQDDKLFLTIEISRNLFLFIRAFAHSKNEDLLSAFFQPVQTDPKEIMEFITSSSLSSSSRPPLMAILFLYLKEFMNYTKWFLSQKHTLILKQDRIDELDMDEITHYVKFIGVDPSQLSISIRHQVCFNQLSQLILHYSHMIDIVLSKTLIIWGCLFHCFLHLYSCFLFSFIFTATLENILVVLWRYMNFILSKPSPSSIVMQDTMAMDEASSMSSSYPVLWRPLLPILEDLVHMELVSRLSYDKKMDRWTFPFFHHFESVTFYNI
jgi:hypothetical protein